MARILHINPASTYNTTAFSREPFVGKILAVVRQIVVGEKLFCPRTIYRDTAEYRGTPREGRAVVDPSSESGQIL